MNHGKMLERLAKQFEDESGSVTLTLIDGGKSDVE